MCRFFIKVCLFLFFGIFVYFILVIIWGEFAPASMQKNLSYEKNGYGHFNSRLKEVKEYKDVDVLILGSSRAYRHYDPRVFKEEGYEIFNLGSSSQTFLQMEILLIQYLREFNPKIIILDIYPAMWSSDGVEASLDLVSNNKLDIETLKLLAHQKNMKVLNTTIYSWYKKILSREKIENEDIYKGNDKYISGGYVEKKLTYSKLIASDTSSFDIKNYQVESFLNIIKQIRNENINLIIVKSPMHKGKVYNSESRLDSIFKLENIKYYNFSNLPDLNDTLHFYNSMHLNQDGVKVFNDFLIKNVLKHELIIP